MTARECVSAFALRSMACEPQYLFISGLHHAGTSLVHLLLAKEPGVASLFNAPSKMAEGHHLQNIWPRPALREIDQCGPYPLSLCIPEMVRLVKSEAQQSSVRAALLAAWEPWWNQSNPGAVLRIEKDPDLGSAFLKAKVFPSASSTFLLVMRHPYYSHRDFFTQCNNALECLSLWATVWVHVAARLDQLSTYAILRYEDLMSGKWDSFAQDLFATLPASVCGSTGLRRSLNGYGFRETPRVG